MLPYTVEEEKAEAEATDAKDVDGKEEYDSTFTKELERQRQAVRTTVRPSGMSGRTKRLPAALNMMVSNCFLSSASCRIALHDPSD